MLEMKFLEGIFNFFYFVSQWEIKTASFFLVHEPKIPKELVEFTYTEK
ncbi:cyclic lactone autoinducer peptide [Priestia megaterium]